jgi:large subunit ribosomal protein L18
MESRVDRKSVRRRIRHRIRRRVGGTATRPRLAVFRSGRHIYAQVIDDQQGRTLAHASTLDPGIRERASAKGATVEAAKLVGATIAERLRGAGVESVTFDRGGFVFHGRVRALAEAAREAGLKF